MTSETLQHLGFVCVHTQVCTFQWLFLSHSPHLSSCSRVATLVVWCSWNTAGKPLHQGLCAWSSLCLWPFRSRVSSFTFLLLWLSCCLPYQRYLPSPCNTKWEYLMSPLISPHPHICFPYPNLLFFYITYLANLAHEPEVAESCSRRFGVMFILWSFSRLLFFFFYYGTKYGLRLLGFFWVFFLHMNIQLF